MTTRRTYTCNLCSDSIKPSDDAYRPCDGFGIYFLATAHVAGRPWLEFRRASDCEKHICHACAKAVHDELRKVTPAPQETPL